MKIGVYFPTAPRMLREAVIGYLRGQPDLDVVVMAARRRPTVELIEAEGLDVLIMEAAGSATSRESAAFLFSLPRLKLIFVGRDGRDATLAQLVIQLENLPDVSAETLTHAIRGGPAPEPGDPAG